MEVCCSFLIHFISNVFYWNFLNTIIHDYSYILLKESNTNLITAVIKFQNINNIKIYSLNANGNNNDSIPMIHLLQML